MVMPVVHFGIGFAGALLVLRLVRAERHYSVALVSGFWALVPQLYYLIPADAPIRDAAHDLFFGSAAGNVFWFHQLVSHYAASTHPTTGSYRLGAIGFALVLLASAYVDVRRANLDAGGDPVGVVRRRLRAADFPWNAHRDAELDSSAEKIE